MRQFARVDTPQYLADNWEKWSERYAQNKTQDTSHTFQWVTHKGKRLNQKLLPLLTQQTQAHCSYCDAYPMKISDETIDHFKPKGSSQFYHLVFQWQNLYYCCADCQKSKWESYHNDLLRPDDIDFSFQRYFIINYSTGEIQSNPAASEREKECADVTIEILGLNHTGQCISRRHSIERFQPESDLEDFAHRFLFD